LPGAVAFAAEEGRKLYGSVFAWALLLGIDAFVACTLLAESALTFAQHLLRHAEPYPLPPHEDPRRITRYSDRVLDPLRTQGDDRAEGTDELIAAIANADKAKFAANAESPADVVAIQDFYKRLLDDRTLMLGQGKFGAHENELVDWARGIAVVPPEFGPQLRRGAAFYKKNLAKITVILSTSALLEAFASARGVNVLASTHYLSDNPERRLYETLQFVLFVSDPNANFDAGGDARNAILRVRLMHGCIRYILQKTPAVGWQNEWGMPINREDLLGMQMGFSGVVIRDLPKLWVDININEANDHIFLWNVVGKLIGAPDELRPASLGEALALIQVIERRQDGPSKAGRTTTAALLSFHRAQLGRFFPVGTYLMRRLAGDHICTMLGVPWSPIASAPLSDLFIDEVIKHWGTRIIFHPAGAAKRPKLYVPPALEEVYDNYVRDNTPGQGPGQGRQG
jgi:hypothetical protein